MVGAALVGFAVVGAAVVGSAVVGSAVLGAAVVGCRVVGTSCTWGHFFSEVDEAAIALQKGHFPDAVQLGNICAIDEKCTSDIIRSFPGSLVLFGAGVPCSEVSYLNEHGGGPVTGQTAFLSDFEVCEIYHRCGFFTFFGHHGMYSHA